VFSQENERNESKREFSLFSLSPVKERPVE